MTDLFSHADGGRMERRVSGRPVLIGMNNPLSDDPRYALAPYPTNVTGWRLWKMLNDQCGASRAAYMRAFDRRNALLARKWDFHAARRQCEGLTDELQGRQVVVLGRDTLSAMRLPGTVPPLEWNQLGSMWWCYVPHPSGLNLWYNDDLHRTAVGLRLEQLYEESIR